VGSPKWIAVCLLLFACVGPLFARAGRHDCECAQAHHSYVTNFYKREPLHIACGQLVSDQQQIVSRVHPELMQKGGTAAKALAVAEGHSCELNSDARIGPFALGEVTHVRLPLHAAGVGAALVSACVDSEHKIRVVVHVTRSNFASL